LLKAWLMDSGHHDGGLENKWDVKNILVDTIGLNQKLECKVSLGHRMAHISLSQVAFGLLKGSGSIRPIRCCRLVTRLTERFSCHLSFSFPCRFICSQFLIGTCPYNSLCTTCTDVYLEHMSSNIHLLKLSR
jgi:hypothetical protein